MASFRTCAPIVFWIDRPRQAPSRRCAIFARRTSWYHTVARARVETTREDDGRRTSVAGFAQNETSWTPWLRTLAGVRVDGYRFHVDASDPRNGGTDTAGLVSPKGGAAFGPWAGTEVYANAGFGFHSNDARGDDHHRSQVG
jgi:outer membrane receptor protein involved in Fe transport